MSTFDILLITLIASPVMFQLIIIGDRLEKINEHLQEIVKLTKGAKNE